MATSSYFRDCPVCPGEDCLDYCHDTKLGVDGGDIATCPECGWQTWVEERFVQIEEINYRRIEEGFKPLNHLRTVK